MADPVKYGHLVTNNSVLIANTRQMLAASRSEPEVQQLNNAPDLFFT